MSRAEEPSRPRTCAPGSEGDPIPRPGARVLLLDAADRLLMFRTAPDPRRPDHEVIWMTPGGASQCGERPDETARRELYEETGFRPPLGPPVWVRDWVWHYGAEGLWYDTREYFYPARLHDAAPDPAPGDYEEMVSLLSHRWLTLTEIGSMTELVSPLRLAELLPPIIAGDYPSEPLQTGQ